MPSLATIQSQKRIQARQERKANNRARWDLIRFSPEEFKLGLARRDWVLLQDQIHNAVAAGESWAIMAELQVFGLIGPQSLVQINLFSKLGVSDEGELTRLLEMGRSAERNALDATRTVEDYAHSARELLCAALPKMDQEFQRETVELVGRASGFSAVAADVVEAGGGLDLEKANGHGAAATNGNEDG